MRKQNMNNKQTEIERFDWFIEQIHVKSSRLQVKIVAYLVSIGWLLCLVFLYGWRFLPKISLDWPLTLKTQPSTSKLSDNPVQTHVAFGSLKANAQLKKLQARELSRNQPILHLDVILQYDWPIKQCLLHIRVFFGGKTKRPRFDLFIHWLITQTTNTYRNHFSRSYENRSNLVCTEKIVVQSQNEIIRI